MPDAAEVRDGEVDEDASGATSRSALRATRITAAGSSVISSQPARNVSGSRAQKTPASDEQERAR